MTTIDFFLCVPKILSNCYVRFPHKETDSVVLLDALEPIGIRLGVRNTCFGDVINFCVLYLLANIHKMSTKGLCPGKSRPTILWVTSDRFALEYYQFSKGWLYSLT